MIAPYAQNVIPFACNNYHRWKPGGKQNVILKKDVCVFSIDHNSNYSSDSGEESYNQAEKSSMQ